MKREPIPNKNNHPAVVKRRAELLAQADDVAREMLNEGFDKHTVKLELVNGGAKIRDARAAVKPAGRMRH